MELGTREYPYRTFQAVMSEIINFFSNSEASLTILTKSVYVENQMANFMNMTLVTVTTHPDLVRLHERALVVPTAISQPEFMEKSRFHLLNSQPTDISQVIADGEYTDVELDLMNRDEYGIAVVRTGFTLSNIDFFQEEIEANLRYQMITVIRLDDKTLTVGKSS